MPEPKQPAPPSSRSSFYQQQAMSEFWEVQEFARLATGCDWRTPEADLSPVQLARVRALEAMANRSIQGKTLRYRASPREWLLWAWQRSIGVPAPLRAAVKAHAPLPAAQDEASAEPSRSPSTLTKERHSMLRLIGGLIQFHYGTLNKPLETGRRISDELAEIPLAIDTETVAKYISLAAAELPRAPQKKP